MRVLIHEAQRVNFLRNRDGYEEALLKIKQIYIIYRKAVLKKQHFASKPYYRKRFIQSYLELKALYLHETKGVKTP